LNIIPSSKISFGPEEEDAIIKCLRSGWITTGPITEEFEIAFAKYTAADAAVSTSSGTSALKIALDLIDLKEGDEVITPSFTWVSVPNLIRLKGARPVFCDIDPSTLNIQPDDIEHRVTSRTKAIIPVHFAGRPAQMDTICEIAEKYELVIIEDACHAIGTIYNERRVGGHGRMAAFSFHPNKNMTTAEGGMLCLDRSLVDRAKQMRFHGISRDSFKRFKGKDLPYYETVFPSIKMNLTDLASSIGLCQLQKVDLFNEKRTNIAKEYIRQLEPLKDLIFIPSINCDGGKHSWHLFNICVKDEDGLRDKVMLDLMNCGIRTGLHYLPVHLMKGMNDIVDGVTLTETERVGRTILSLPLFPDMEDEDVSRVVNALKGVLF